MLRVRTTKIEEGTHVEFSGTFEESVHLDSLIGPVSRSLIINCRSLTRINSIGVKTWMHYFLRQKNSGVRVRFEECSPTVVEQMNLISNFSCGGEVKSVLLPYSCAKCMKEFVFLIEDVERLNIAALPSPKCERSDCEAQCDDDPEEYLSFLKS